MAGWNLSEGICTDENPTDFAFWESLNNLFKNGRKTTTYKFCFMKCLTDYSIQSYDREVLFSTIFRRFTEIYWDLIVKYGLSQVYENTNTNKSKIETIIESAVPNEPGNSNVKLTDIPEFIRSQLYKDVENQCSRHVVGAFFDSTYGLFYSFSKRNRTILFSDAALRFLRKYHDFIEEINYFNWAKMIEKINGDNTPQALVLKMSCLGSEVYNNPAAWNTWPNWPGVPTQKYNLADILPWTS